MANFRVRHNLGAEKNPVILRVSSKEKIKKLIKLCKEYEFKYIIGIEPLQAEDISDLRKAIKQKFSPDNIYDPCPCGSGNKYKFCCKGEEVELNIL